MQHNHSTPAGRLSFLTSLALGGWLAFGLGVPQLAGADEAALDRLQEAVERNSDAETIQFDLQVQMSQSMQGQREEATSDASVHVQRPDRLAIRTAQPEPLINTLVIDADHFREAVPALDGYVERPAPADLAAAWRGETIVDAGGGGWVLILGPLLDAAMFEAVRGAVVEAERVGEEDVDGEPAEQLRLRFGPVRDIEPLPAEVRQSLGDMELIFDVWTTMGDEPQIRRIVPDLMAMIEQMGPQFPAGQQPEMGMAMALSNWRLDEPINEAAFDFEPADGARQARSVAELHEARQQQQGGGPAAQLSGEPAPVFELDRLEGGQANLADQLGEQVIILDFWATWCGPCVHTMPIYQRLMDDYADEGVQIYAVNLREDEDQIRTFMDQHDLTLPVLLDRQGAVAQRYHVRGIPQSVVIGPDGTVQAVHVGALPNLEGQLRREVDALLAGDSLVD